MYSVVFVNVFFVGCANRSTCVDKTGRDSREATGLPRGARGEASADDLSRFSRESYN